MVLRISDVSKAFGPVQVLNGVSFLVNKGDRVGLVGPNGVGKSTLLRIIVGEIEPDDGKVRVAPDTDIGYLAQATGSMVGQTLAHLIDDARGRLDALSARIAHLEARMGGESGDVLQSTLDEYAWSIERFEHLGGYDCAHRVDEVLDGLGLAGLPRDREMGTLSSGENARLGLAALLLRSPDLLVLDEPTNHLDLNALAWLEGFLRGHRGAVLIVSHDRRFLNETVNSIVEIAGHSRQATVYVGDYDAFLARKREERERWAEDYQRQQEEIRELERTVRTTARQVAHNRPQGTTTNWPVTSSAHEFRPPWLATFVQPRSG